MENKKILLSANAKGENYINAVKSLNATPVIYTGVENLNDYSGLILCGGEDMHPKFYGETIKGSVNINLNRDITEIALSKRFLSENKPILAICRGFQLLNVVLGGTLIQNLTTAKNHIGNENGDAYHTVNAKKGSLVSKLYGDTFVVNSYHHQGVSRLGNGLIDTAYSLDGVLECYEGFNLKVLGFQSHPERAMLNFYNKNAFNGEKIFEFFLRG